MNYIRMKLPLILEGKSKELPKTGNYIIVAYGLMLAGLSVFSGCVLIRKTKQN